MLCISPCWWRIPVSILYKSTAGRYRPVRVADGPITARCRLIKNASWVCCCPWWILLNWSNIYISRWGKFIFVTCFAERNLTVSNFVLQSTRARPACASAPSDQDLSCSSKGSLAAVADERSGSNATRLRLIPAFVISHSLSSHLFLLYLLRQPAFRFAYN